MVHLRQKGRQTTDRRSTPVHEIGHGTLPDGNSVRSSSCFVLCSVLSVELNLGKETNARKCLRTLCQQVGFLVFCVFVFVFCLVVLFVCFLCLISGIQVSPEC